MRPEGSLWRELWEGCPGFKKGIMRVKESLSASGLMSIIGYGIQKYGTLTYCIF